MALPFPVSYGTAVNQSIQGSKGITTSVNNLVEIPDGAQTGAITCTILSDSTAVTLVDGTALTNATNSVEVVLTFVDEVVPLSLKPSQIKSKLTNPKWMDAIIANHASALMLSANNALVADMVASTPGKVETLAAGRMDFNPGTDAENDVSFGQMIKCLTYLQTNFQDARSMDEFGIILASDAYANFTTLKSTRRSYEPIFGADGVVRFMNVPIFGTTISTDFGGASNECAFLYHSTAACIAFQEPGLLGGKPFLGTDGHWKFVTSGPYAHGVVNVVLLASVLNGAS